MYAAARSYHSLCYGTLPAEDLVATAKRHSLPALAGTDINKTAGAFPFVKACQAAGIDSAYGNRNLVCSCMPVESYEPKEVREAKVE